MGAGGQAGVAGSQQGGSAGNAGAAGGTGTIGAKCVKDTDCASGTCITSDSTEFFGGGPAFGYCSRECSADPLVCGDKGTCADVSLAEDGSKQYCLENCSFGPKVSSLNGKLDPTKCHGRAQLACKGWDGQCMPRCLLDKDCAGKKCDQRHGVCVDSLPADRLPIGSDCSEYGLKKTDIDPCEGNCIPSGKTGTPVAGESKKVYVCSSGCTYNELEEGCGFGQDPPAGVCLLGVPGTGSGDWAACSKFCDVDSDCTDYVKLNAYCNLAALDQGWPRGTCEWGYSTADAGTEGGPGDAGGDAAADGSADSSGGGDAAADASADSSGGDDAAADASADSSDGDDAADN